MSEFSRAWDAVPPVTRFLLISTLAVTGPALLAIISPYNYFLTWTRTAYNFELWRPFTAFFFGGGGFPFLYDLFLLYRNSSSLETNIHHGDTAGYAWQVLVISLLIMVLNTVLQHPFLFRPLLSAQTYLWCRANPTMKVSIFGLITIPTSLYPPALVVLDLLTGGPGKAMGSIMGIVAGHIWWFCETYLPVHAPTALKRSNPFYVRPRFRALFRARPARSNTSTGSFTASGPIGATSARASGESAADAVRHRWGGGQKLGGSSL